MTQVVLSSFILSSIWGITEFRIQKNGKKEKENSFRSYTDSNKQAIKTSTLKIEIGRRTQKQKQRRMIKQLTVKNLLIRMRSAMIPSAQGHKEA